MAATSFVAPVGMRPVRLSGDNSAETAPVVVPPSPGMPGSAMPLWPTFNTQDHAGSAGKPATAPAGFLAGRGSTIGKLAPTIAALPIMNLSDDMGDEPASALLPGGAATAPDLGFAGSELSSLSPTPEEASARRARDATADPGDTARATERHAEPEPETLLQADTAAVVAPGRLDAGASVPNHPAPAATHLPASIADQVAPAMAAVVRNGEAGGRVTVSVTPGELGRVNITVERNGDGTMHIQVSAEHLATLELLRRDQTELARTLDQADTSSGNHSLSFSLDSGMAGGGGTHGWFTGGSQQEAPAPVAPLAYVDTTTAAAAPIGRPANRRGSIDVTA